MRGKYVTCEDGHMTLTISWSQLRMFEECRQKVSLLKQGKRAHLSDARVFFPGTVVDRVVRDFLHDRPDERGIMPDMVRDVMEREEKLLLSDENRIVRWKDKQDKAAVEADCIQAVKNIEPALVKYVLPYEYQVDYRFRVPLDIPIGDEKIRALLIGAMDITVHDPEKGWWANYDVKMTKDNEYWKKTRGQMTFYDLANMLIRGKPPLANALLQPMCDKQVRVIPVTQESRSQMLSHIITFARAHVKDDMGMTAKPSACRYCEFKHACPKFKPVVNDKGLKTISF